MSCLVNKDLYCRPRAGGDLFIQLHRCHARRGSPPARGRQDKDSYARI